MLLYCHWSVDEAQKKKLSEKESERERGKKEEVI